jgi:hypothetical protein
VKYDTPQSRLTKGWQDLRQAAFRRSGGLCEFCGYSMQSFELHHRWYPQNATLNCLMAIHPKCHRHIHFGGKFMALPQSLAYQGDTGKGNNSRWRAYLKAAL